MASEKSLSERAEELRKKRAPLPADKVVAAWSDIPNNPPGYNGSGEAKCCIEFLRQRGVKVGTSIKGDGRCQFAAFSLAAFGTADHADELCQLAVDYLRKHKVEYEDSMLQYLNERNKHLVELKKAGKISEPDYDGLLKAIEMGLEWGNDQTLLAMAIMMQVEVRLLQNLPCDPSAPAPRLLPLKIDSSRGHVGVMSSVIYLFLHNEHYQPLENGVVPAPAQSLPAAPPTEYSVRQGSIHTDKDADITYGWSKDGDPYADEYMIRFEGEAFYPSHLTGDGVSLGNGTGKRLIMRPSPDGKEWIIYCVWAHQDACSWRPLDRGGNHVLTGRWQEMRREPRKTKPGPEKRIRKEKPPEESPAPQSPPMVRTDSIRGIGSELQQRGYRATSMVAQRLFECINQHVSGLELELFTGDANDHTPLALISSEVLAIRKKLLEIKRNLTFIASEHSLPIESVMVVGDSGVGKSTTINHMIHDAWKVGEDQVPQEMKVLDEVFRAGETVLDAQDEDAEQATLNEAKEVRAVRTKFNKGPKDILPAGSGNAMTALPTNIFFNPSAEHIQLHITYYTKSQVDEVLRYGKAVHDGEVGDDVNDLKATHAAVLLGIPRGDNMNSEDLLEQYEGPFTLPARFDKLLGSQPTKRIFTIKGGDRPDEAGRRPAATKLKDLMLLHTIGHWSYWPVIEKIELVVPSNLTHPLRVIDVPGFGKEGRDSFRQGIVDDQLKQPVSTLCLVLRPDRIGHRASSPFDRLDKLGIVDDLLANLKHRQVGKFMTVVAIDWALEQFLKEEPLDSAKEDIEKEHDSLIEESKTFLFNELKAAAKAKQHGDATIGKPEKDALNERAAQAMENVQPFAIDVCSRLAEYAIVKPLQIRSLLEQLLDNKETNLERQQEAYLQEVVNQCLLPFYSKLDQICRFRELVDKGKDARLEKLNAQAILGNVRDLIGQKLSTSENSERVKRLTQKVLHPKKQECTIDAIKLRWPEMEYSRPRCHLLGKHLKSRTPEKTDLPDLMIKALARDAMLPLQEELRAMQKEMIETTANKLRDLVLDLMSKRLRKNVSNAPDLEGTLKSAWGIAEKGLRDGVRHIVDHFHRWFELRILSLRESLPQILREALQMEDLAKLAGKRGTNEMRRDELGRMTVGNDSERGLADMVVVGISSRVKSEIFSDIERNFTDRFGKLVDYSIGVMSNALSGDIKELVQVQGFGVSLEIARKVARIIEEIHTSKKAESCFNHIKEDELKAIKNVAQSDAPIALVASTGTDFARASGAVDGSQVEEDAEEDAEVAQPADEWQCPNCLVPASHTDVSKRGKYLLEALCHFNVNCLCKELERDVEYCNLCVRYFARHHKHRSRKTEIVRQGRGKRRRSDEAGTPAKQACLALDSAVHPPVIALGP